MRFKVKEPRVKEGTKDLLVKWFAKKRDSNSCDKTKTYKSVPKTTF